MSIRITITTKGKIVYNNFHNTLETRTLAKRYKFDADEIFKQLTFEGEANINHNQFFLHAIYV